MSSLKYPSTPQDREIPNMNCKKVVKIMNQPRFVFFGFRLENKCADIGSKNDKKP